MATILFHLSMLIGAVVIFYAPNLVTRPLDRALRHIPAVNYACNHDWVGVVFPVLLALLGLYGLAFYGFLYFWAIVMNVRPEHEVIAEHARMIAGREADARLVIRRIEDEDAREAKDLHHAIVGKKQVHLIIERAAIVERLKAEYAAAQERAAEERKLAFHALPWNEKLAEIARRRDAPPIIEPVIFENDETRWIDEEIAAVDAEVAPLRAIFEPIENVRIAERIAEEARWAEEAATARRLAATAERRAEEKIARDIEWEMDRARRGPTLYEQCLAIREMRDAEYEAAHPKKKKGGFLKGLGLATAAVAVGYIAYEEKEQKWAKERREKDERDRDRRA